jgi:hypothetical protein
MTHREKTDSRKANNFICFIRFRIVLKSFRRKTQKVNFKMTCEHMRHKKKSPAVLRF